MKVITDEMVKKAFEHINNRAHPIYGTFNESQLDNPYGRAAFANAIEELYDIKMTQVPTLEEINSFRVNYNCMEAQGCPDTCGDCELRND
jgi:hypothetical protein